VTVLYQDFESRSVLDLNVVGLDRYVKDKSTEPILLAHAIDDAAPSLWQKHIDGGLPSELRDALTDPHVIKVAWNSQFERSMWKYGFRIDIPYEQWEDPMIQARFMSMPGYLEDVSKIIRLDDDTAKMSWGTKKDPGEAQKLIKMFCTPSVQGKETPLFGTMPAWFRDWDSDPEMWQRFCEYCKQDLIAMRAIKKKMAAFPLPESERRAWYIDQEINERGVFCDLPLARGSATVAEHVKTELHARIKQLAGVENPNSNPQLLAWLQTQGYTFSGLAKGFVTRAMDGECELTPDAREVLELRKQSAKTSDAKLETILESVCDDGRLRHQYAFMGASRTGRWSGKGDYGGAQLQNLPRPNKAVAKRLDTAIHLLREGDYLGLSLEFPSPMEAVTTALRSIFRAAPGKKLLVCDLNAIENRVLGWLTGCEAITDVFRQGKCPYLNFAVKMYGLSYEELKTRYDAGDEEVKEMRQNSKPPVLGAGYQLSGGEEKIDKETGDKIFTGLMNYSRMMGVEMPHDLCHKAITTFREEFGEVPVFWYASEDAAIEALRTGRTTTVGPLTFIPHGKGLLQMVLPSGRPLNYIRPLIEKDERFNKEGITYEGKLQGTQKWARIKGYGGKWTEQSDQAISRDLLVAAMFRARKKGLPIVLHSHDELVCEVDKNSTFALEDLRECMIQSPEWAKDLLIDAEGWEGDYYKK
jgi:DNA polymerase